MAANDGGLEVTKAELSRILGASTTTVDKWIARGCPHSPPTKTRRSYRFNSAAVHAWILARDTKPPESALLIPLEESRKRKLAAEAEDAELDLRARRGELVEVDTAAELAEAAFATVRLRLLSVPSKVAPRIASIRSAAKCRRLLEDEFREVLDELVDGGVLVARAVERDGEKRVRKGSRVGRGSSSTPAA